ncbi:unnamed protein product [Didymodactylos carnosus]|uniref:Uncharacterized protein n=1 Tax=Didymodactylos carnosus TaxID=1234261 RepID=A0A815AHK0_9BILA|nr:unnamed protein product [Didymodactylos carnosus]CAF1257820.1 unnamed protein product [Didymodactylos carnosus]CAF3816972.1 unnamed protein product [Didymodactylos carnosus]CAF4032558.1 unnamed protein product [Didymodactylos carnosus]
MSLCLLLFSEQHGLCVESGQFYPNSVQSLINDTNIDYFEAVDGSRAAEAIVDSILINGRGIYFDRLANYSSTTPLERLSVSVNQTYRLRLINGGSVFSLRFSIDMHSLEVIESDGLPFEQSIVVDQIIVGLGERFDLLINTTNINPNSNYMIRVDTLDKNNNPRWHGRAILEYSNNNIDVEQEESFISKNCSKQYPCRILNCPFTQYGSDKDSFICLTYSNMTTSSIHIDKNLVQLETTNITLRKTISLTHVEPSLSTQMSGYEAINWIGMKLPILTQPILFDPIEARNQFTCTNTLLLSETNGEKCYHHVVLKLNDTIEFLVINHDDDQHPMHLHGHYFHVVEQGLAELNETSGIYVSNNPNVECDEHAQCQYKANISTNNNVLLVKDTVQVAKGG